MNILTFGHKHIFTTEGGVEVVVTELYTRMARMGHRIKVLDRYEIDRKRDAGEHDIENLTVINIPTLSNSKLNAQLYSMFATIYAMFAVSDIVHVHAEGPCVFLWLLKLAGKKVIVTIHGLDWQRAKWGRFASWYIKTGEKMAARYADRIIVLNQDTVDYFKEVYGRETVLIPNGVDLKHPDKTDQIERFGLEKNKYILYMGRFADEKRLDLLVQAYWTIKTDKKLVIAGDVNGFEHKDWMLKGKEHPDIIFTGFAGGELKDQLLYNAGLYILPSDIEGMSIALLEGLGTGVPVLCSDIQENTSILDRYGTTFRKGDLEDLEKKMQELCDEPFCRNSEQTEYVRKNFSWNNTVERTLEVYADALRGKESKI